MKEILKSRSAVKMAAMLNTILGGQHVQKSRSAVKMAAMLNSFSVKH